MVGGLSALTWSFDAIDGIERLLVSLHNNLLQADCEAACASAVHLTTSGRVAVAVALVIAVALLAAGAQLLHNRVKAGELLERAVLRRYAREARDVYRHALKHGVPILETAAEFRIRIHADYSVESVFERTIEAVDAPLEMIGWTTVGDPPDGARVPHENFTAEVVAGGRRLLTVPCQVGNEKEAKFVLFLYPALRPGDSPVTLRLKARWPKSARALESLDRADTNVYTVHPRVSAPVGRVTMSVRVDLPGTFSFDREFAASHCDGEPEWASDDRSCSLVAKGVKKGASLSIDVTRVTFGAGK